MSEQYLTKVDPKMEGQCPSSVYQCGGEWYGPFSPHFGRDCERLATREDSAVADHDELRAGVACQGMVGIQGRWGTAVS